MNILVPLRPEALDLSNYSSATGIIIGVGDDNLTSFICKDSKSIERWNGILPQVSGGAVPFIDLGKMEGVPGAGKK